jgi:hypothetical protein
MQCVLWAWWHLQIFECLVAVWSLISKGHLSSQCGGDYILWQQISPPAEARFHQVRVGKSLKYSFAFCAAGDAGEKRTFDSVLDIFYSGSEILVADLKVMGFTAKRLKFGMCNQILHLFAECFLKFWTHFIHSMKDYECCGWNSSACFWASELGSE